MAKISVSVPDDVLQVAHGFRARYRVLRRSGRSRRQSFRIARRIVQRMKEEFK